jgi:hypothetical protein
VSSKEAFKNFINFQGYTEEFYSCVVNFSNNYWTNSWNWGEDEMTSTAGNYHFVHKIDNGNFWGWQRESDGQGLRLDGSGDFTTSNGDVFANRAFRDLWSAAWFGLRKVSLGLENIDKLTEATSGRKN